MLLESVGISALFLTRLAVPSQPLKTLGLHAVGDEFRGSDFSFAHDVGVVVVLCKLVKFDIQNAGH
jgi:hypothetical protein